MEGHFIIAYANLPPNFFNIELHTPFLGAVYLKAALIGKLYFVRLASIVCNISSTVLDVFQQPTEYGLDMNYGSDLARAFLHLFIDMPHEKQAVNWKIHHPAQEFVEAARDKAPDSPEYGVLLLSMRPDTYLLAGHISWLFNHADFASFTPESKTLFKDIVDLSLKHGSELLFRHAMGMILSQMEKRYEQLTTENIGGFNFSNIITVAFGKSEVPEFPDTIDGAKVAAHEYFERLTKIVSLFKNPATYGEGLLEAERYGKGE